jgi:hypothetical protein
MGKCKCGFSTDAEKNCNGTHNIVKAVRQQIVKDLESIDLGENNNHLNAVGMRMIAISIAKGHYKKPIKEGSWDD